MQQEQPGSGDPIGPQEWRKLLQFEPDTASHRLGWVGLQAARCRAEPPTELNPPAIPYHRLILVNRPPEELDLVYEGVNRHVPPLAGAIMLLPAGSPARVRTSGCPDALHILLDPALVARVAVDAFGLNPDRLTVPPLDGLDLPHLRAAMSAVDAELIAAAAGGRLAAESLANVLAVHLLRHILAPRRLERGPDGVLPRVRLRAVVEYVEENLHAGLTLEEMAAVARLSPYHFARQFKAATGLPPHHYVITRRVERAKQLLEHDRDLSLAEAAARAGFSDQSQFSHHFKRLVGVTPGQFRRSA